MFKILSGPRLNLVGRGAQYGPTGQYGPGSAPDPSALWPLANLFDGRPATPTKWTSTVLGVAITFPNNLVANGDFEQGTTGWTSSGATFTSETGAGFFHKGLKSAKLVNTSTFGNIYRDVIVQAGEWLNIMAAARSDGTNTAYLVVTCRETAKSLNAAGAWVSGSGGCFSKTAATMAAFAPITFQAPSFAELGKPTATLRIQCVGQQNSFTHYWDEVLLVPGFNFVGMFGHGFPASTGLVVGDSGANYWHAPSSTLSLVGTAGNAAGVRQSASALAGSMQYDPFPSVFFEPAGSMSALLTPEIPWVGELVVGQASDLTRNPDYPVAIEYRQPNIRYQTPGGSQWVLPRGSNPLRRVTISFAYHNDAEYVAGRDALYGMSAGGAYPLILIPTETDSGEAIYGRLEDSTAFTRVGYGERRAEFIVQEEAGPWV